MRCRKKNASAACERETKNVSYRGSTLARAANEYCAVRWRSCSKRPRIDPPLYLFYFGANVELDHGDKEV